MIEPLIPLPVATEVVPRLWHPSDSIRLMSLSGFLGNPEPGHSRQSRRKRVGSAPRPRSRHDRAYAFGDPRVTPSIIRCEPRERYVSGNELDHILGWHAG